jgi:hypothetical protein
LLEQLELAGELPLGLTLDASAASRSFRRTAELPVEPWNRLVWRLREAGVELECHGVVPPREGAPTGGAFLRFATDLGPVRSGVDWVSEWLITLARKDGNEAERVRAARNLASSGFAPALEWMGELAERGADRAAREGLVRAAARGRVSSALTAPDVLGSLLLEAEQAGGHASARILVALTRLGCLDSHGAPLAGRFLAEFRAVSVRGRWTRLFLLERNRCASEAIFSEAQALLVDPATPAPLALQALHFCVARGEVLPGALRVAGLPAFFGLALDADESERLARALRLAGLKPPFRDPATVPADWQPPERARLLEAWLWSSDEEAAASHLAACLAGPTTEREARRGALVQSLERARARGEGARLERLLAKASTLQPPLEGELERMRLGRPRGRPRPARRHGRLSAPDGARDPGAGHAARPVRGGGCGTERERRDLAPGGSGAARDCRALRRAPRRRGLRPGARAHAGPRTRRLAPRARARTARLARPPGG